MQVWVIYSFATSIVWILVIADELGVSRAAMLTPAPRHTRTHGVAHTVVVLQLALPQPLGCCWACPTLWLVSLSLPSATV